MKRRSIAFTRISLLLFGVLLAGCSQLNKSPELETQSLSAGDMMMVHQSSMEAFKFYRTSPIYQTLDWATNYCSWSPDSAWVFYDFHDACARHDFGYRNYKNYGVYAENKGLIDSIFYQDMRDHCATHNWFTRIQCEEAAASYYGYVSNFVG